MATDRRLGRRDATQNARSRTRPRGVDSYALSARRERRCRRGGDLRVVLGSGCGPGADTLDMTWVTAIRNAVAGLAGLFAGWVVPLLSGAAGARGGWVLAPGILGLPAVGAVAMVGRGLLPWHRQRALVATALLAAVVGVALSRSAPLTHGRLWS